jgi:hypothetical protein
MQHLGWEVLVAVQGGAPAGVPQRPDVRVLSLATTGVAKSRNAVLREARGELVLFADDDVAFDEAGVSRALAEFAADPRLAILLGRAVDETGALRKRYPARRADLTLWNCARAATYEMVVRTDLIRAAGLRFDEDFGAGVANYLGDEYVFIADALRRGLHCEFAPITLATHPVDSSGARFGSRADARARAAVFERVFGGLAPLVRLGFVARRPSRFASLPLALRFVTGEPRRAPTGAVTRGRPGAADARAVAARQGSRHPAGVPAAGRGTRLPQPRPAGAAGTQAARARPPAAAAPAAQRGQRVREPGRRIPAPRPAPSPGVAVPVGGPPADLVPEHIERAS